MFIRVSATFGPFFVIAVGGPLFCGAVIGTVLLDRNIEYTSVVGS